MDKVQRISQSGNYSDCTKGRPLLGETVTWGTVPAKA